MADEQTKEPYVPASGAPKPPSIVPDECSWPSLVKKDGDELFDHYRHLLEKLVRARGSGLAPQQLVLVAND